jgi:hypothetical protein
MPAIGKFRPALRSMGTTVADFIEQFGKRGHVDHWQSAVPSSLSEAIHGRWREISNGLLSLKHTRQRGK